jgi:hypothetical protein
MAALVPSEEHTKVGTQIRRRQNAMVSCPLCRDAASNVNARGVTQRAAMFKTIVGNSDED